MIPSRALTRRRALQWIGGSLVGGLAFPSLDNTALAAPRTARLDLDATAFLDEMERQACLYFYEQADPATGQILDRANNHLPEGQMDPRFASSIAATGFGLTALCIADSRKYLPSDRIRRRVIATLQFHLRPMPTEHGFYYHFNDVKTGLPLLNIEVSPIDTAILLCGILTCRAYFKDPKITDLATQIYNRVDWPWIGSRSFISSAVTIRSLSTCIPTPGSTSIGNGIRTRTTSPTPSLPSGLTRHSVSA
jgi:hypothetical protein